MATQILSKIQEITDQSLMTMLNQLANKPMTAMSHTNNKKIAIKSTK